MYRAITAALIVPLLWLWGFACFHYDRMATEQTKEHRQMALENRADTVYDLIAWVKKWEDIAAAVIANYRYEQLNRKQEIANSLEGVRMLQCPKDGKALPWHWRCFDVREDLIESVTTKFTN